MAKIGLRRLRPDHIDRLYDQKLNPTDGRRALAPKTGYEIHLVIRGALTDAVRRGLVHRNVALLARSPLQRSFPPVEKKAWTAAQLRAFLRAAAGHRLFPALWLSAFTGMRRSELLGLRWHDLNVKHARLSINRGLVSVGYELRESRGKTANARRTIDLDPTTIDVLQCWQAFQSAERRAVGIEDCDQMFTGASGEPVHPHAISQAFERIVRRAGVPIISLHGLRHTHGSLLVEAGILVKVVTERLGHAQEVFTIETYQHVMPGMQAKAASTFEDRLNPVERPHNDEGPGR